MGLKRRFERFCAVGVKCVECGSRRSVAVEAEGEGGEGLGGEKLRRKRKKEGFAGTDEGGAEE